MQPEAIEFLKKLLATPGVSGYEQQVQQVVRDYIRPFAHDVRTDLHGNVVAVVNPDAPVRVMLAGHADQIGLIVAHIDENGFLFVQTIGGWDPQQLVGQRMTVWTQAGPVNGVIARKPIHLLDEAERKQVVKTKELWIDIGAADREEAASCVAIGDSVTLQMGIQDLKNNLVNGPAIDNRVGVWVVMEALRRAADRGINCGLYAVSTVQEEIGLRGARTAAYGIDPQIGIAVDVTHATDCPTIDPRQLGDIRVGAGPVIVRGPNINPEVSRRLRALAGEHELPTQLSALGRAAPNDSNAIQVNRQGVAAGIVAIPNRYMHSAVETVSLDDLDHAAQLLALFAHVTADAESFIPGTLTE